MSESATKPSPVPRPRTDESDNESPDETGEVRTSRHAGRMRRFVRRTARPRVLLPLLLICALLAGVAVLGIGWYKDNALHEARSSAVSSAREYAVALTSYDYKKLRSDFDKVSSNATGQFAEEYKKVSSNLTKLIRKNKAVSKGNVVAAGLVSGDRHRAVVVLFVDQTITNTNISKPRIDRNRMRMTLRHKNDHWLIDNVELL